MYEWPEQHGDLTCEPDVVHLRYRLYLGKHIRVDLNNLSGSRWDFRSRASVPAFHAHSPMWVIMATIVMSCARTSEYRCQVGLVLPDNFWPNRKQFWAPRAIQARKNDRELPSVSRHFYRLPGPTSPYVWESSSAAGCNRTWSKRVFFMKWSTLWGETLYIYGRTGRSPLWLHPLPLPLLLCH